MISGSWFGQMDTTMEQSRQGKRFNQWKSARRRLLFREVNSLESFTTRCPQERRTTSRQGRGLVPPCRRRTWRSPSGSTWCVSLSLFLLVWGKLMKSLFNLIIPNQSIQVINYLVYKLSQFHVFNFVQYLISFSKWMIKLWVWFYTSFVTIIFRRELTYFTHSLSLSLTRNLVKCFLS